MVSGHICVDQSSWTSIIHLRSIGDPENIIIPRCNRTLQLPNKIRFYIFQATYAQFSTEDLDTKIPRNTTHFNLNMCTNLSFQHWCKCGKESELEGPKLSPCSAKGTSDCKGTEDQEIQEWNSEKRCRECETKHSEEEREEEETKQQKK